MTDAADALITGGIQDAATALEAIREFQGKWQSFAQACQAGQFDVASKRAETLIALVETAADLFLTTNRRIAQCERLTRGITDEQA